MKKSDGGGTSSTAYPSVSSSRPTTIITTSSSTCGGGDGIRVLYANAANGTWCGFAPSLRNAQASVVEGLRWR
jgi:hypothetical protein